MALASLIRCGASSCDVHELFVGTTSSFHFKNEDLFMQRRSLLKFGGAVSVLAGVSATGCGGGSVDASNDLKFADIRADQRSLYYDASGSAIEWSPADNWVRSYDASNALQWTFDGVGTSVGALNAPSGVVALGERIYVSDFGNSRVIVLNRRGDFLFKFGEAGEDREDFSFVHEPVVGPDQLLYFCDALNNRVQVWNGNGQWLRSIGAFGTSGFGLNYTESLAFDAAGLMHVIDSGNGRVVVFGQDGQGVRTYGSLGSGPGQMLNSEGIAIGPNGYVYVADRSQCLVHIYDNKGNFIKRVPVFLANGDYGVPGEVCWLPNGMLHVTATPDGSKGLIPRQYL